MENSDTLSAPANGALKCKQHHRANRQQIGLNIAPLVSLVHIQYMISYRVGQYNYHINLINITFLHVVSCKNCKDVHGGKLFL